MMVFNLIKRLKKQSLQDLSINLPVTKKITHNGTIYIETDETYVKAIKIVNNVRKVIKKRIRLTIIHTGYDNSTKRPQIINKRMIITMTDEQKNIESSNYWRGIESFIHEHYENAQNANFLIIGDGAGYIENGTNFIINSHFILDNFHKHQSVEKAIKKQDSFSISIKKSLHLALKKLNLTLFNQVILKYQKTLSDSKAILWIKQLSKYINNQTTGIKNQNHSKNIGCRIESYISHYIKSMLRSRPKIFNEQTIYKTLLIKQMIFNELNPLETLLKENIQKREVERFKWNFNFKKNISIPKTYNLTYQFAKETNKRKIAEQILYNYY